MIKGRRTSPDTGVGPFGNGNEAVFCSGDSNAPEEETGVLRGRGGGIFLTLDADVFLSSRSACGEFGVGGITEVGASRMVSDEGTGICADCGAVALISGSAGAMVGFGVSGPLSRLSLQVASFSDTKRIGGNPDSPSM